MKKSLLIGLVSLAAAATQSFGQGLIVLDNYFSNGGNGGPFVTYGEAGVPANGTSGGAGSVGAALGQGSWTAGFYWVAGSPAIGADPNSKAIGDPSSFTGGLALATGTGSSVGIDTAQTGFTPGAFLSGQTFAFPGVAANGTVTIEMVAYNGASYAASSYRGHSAAFTMTVSDPTSNNPNKVGNFMPAFSVFAVPEPSVFALAGLGGAFLMLVRRKK